MSKAQLALLHTAESVGISSLLTFVVGLLQYIATHQANWQELLTVFGSGFISCLAMIYKTVSSSPDLPQAESDTLQEIKDAIHQRFYSLEAMLRLHTSIAPAQPSTPVVAPPSVPQVPFPSNVTMMPPGSPVLSVGNPVLNLPQRSWSDSALLPAMPVPPKG